jgi:GrpB-like predicted nucleotidyltransferase (UPF0157 family)
MGYIIELVQYRPFEIMTELLQQVMAEIAKLPDDTQDSIASRLMSDLKDEQAWTDSFATTTTRIARKVQVVPHNPNWLSEFDTEANQIAVALGENAVAIHHIGSTSIETIHAKPIIDILIEVRSIDKVDDRNSAMQTLGYECLGEFGIADRRFFRKNNAAGIRTHHVHIFDVDSAQIARHLAFRDYINAHPEAAWEYSELKQSLARQYPQNIQAYMDGKDGFIRSIDIKAAAWRITSN